MKKTLIILSLILILGVLSIGCSNNVATDIPTKYIEASFVIDLDNKNAVVGYADYVFVVYIDELIDTEYKFPVQLGLKTISSPYTNYSVTVIDNIKGNLKKNIPIIIQKSGGLNEDGKSYEMYSGDSLPEVGNYYILIAYGQPDGTTLLSGPNSNILVEGETKNDILQSDIYKEYVDAFKNEIKTDRERSTSKYED